MALPSSGTPDDLEELNAAAEPLTPMAAPEAATSVEPAGEDSSEGGRFTYEETVFIFDWDDTVLPSTWVQRQGLTLDDSTQVNEWQAEQLDQIAQVAAETLRLAKQYGE